jgi:hypothetical protein
VRTIHFVLLRRLCHVVPLALFGFAVGNIAQGQTVTTSAIVQPVGGVSIDTGGVLSNARTDDLGVLSKLRQRSLEKIPADLNPAVEMRKISLRRLEAALEECAQNKKPIPDALQYLAGLQHIRYLFVYPEQKDIVLVGPGEGWKVDARGNVVGLATGRPVMLLDDLLVALRTAHAAARGGITCSIDPTPEGLARIKSPVRGSDPLLVAQDLESALGMQRISVEGVPATSHFARVLVAADYRMKRIAMNFDPSPVRGLPSYLQMVRPGARSVLSPRFWLEPRYEALLRDADHLAFELHNSSVKAMTEEDHVAAGGRIEHSGKASPAAQRWADIMTAKYPELAVADPIFGQLQNCMDLAVVGALIAKERLAEKAGYSMPVLLESSDIQPVVFNAPKQVPSKASTLKRGHTWVISVSGGVAIYSWSLADGAKPSETVKAVRTQAAPDENANWWWN